MIFKFEMRKEFGNRRYYPINPPACELMQVSNRQMLRQQEIEKLIIAGWPIKAYQIHGKEILFEPPQQTI